VSFLFSTTSASFPAGTEDFTQVHITSISWALDSATHEVTALQLSAFQGDENCGISTFNCYKASPGLDQDSFDPGGLRCTGGPAPACFGFVDPPNTDVSFVDVTPAYACEGFKGPLAKGPVAIKRQRLHWLRATLRDEDGKRLRRRDLPAPPVVDVTCEPPVDAATPSLAPWPGIGGDGTAFVGVGNQWHLLLKLEDLTDPATYTVTMDPATRRPTASIPPAWVSLCVEPARRREREQALGRCEASIAPRTTVRTLPQATSISVLPKSSPLNSRGSPVALASA